MKEPTIYRNSLVSELSFFQGIGGEMKVKLYEKSYNSTLVIVGHKIAIQRDSSKYRIWSITHTGDKEMPVQQDGCSAWVSTGDGEFTCIEPIVNECEECGAFHAPGENTMCNR